MLHIIFLLCLSTFFITLICVVGWREHTMTLMWRSGTSLQKLVLSFYYAGPRGNQTQPSGLTEPFHLSNLTSLENHLMYNFLLYFLSNRQLHVSKGKKKMLSGIFYPCLLAYWTPLPRSSQSTSVLGVCQSSPCLSTSAISLCPWTCAFVTQLCICPNYTQHSVLCTSQFLCCSPWCYICTL